MIDEISKNMPKQVNIIQLVLIQWLQPSLVNLITLVITIIFILMHIMSIFMMQTQVTTMFHKFRPHILIYLVIIFLVSWTQTSSMGWSEQDGWGVHAECQGVWNTTITIPGVGAGTISSSPGGWSWDSYF
jgi:hypothetical protein